jgi:hypothetical protein
MKFLIILLKELRYRKTFLLCLLTSFCLAGNILSQTKGSNSGSHSVTLSFGMSDFHIRDDLGTPLIFRNNGLNGSLSYDHSKHNYKQALDIEFYQAGLNSKFDEYHADNYRLSIGYDFYKKLFTYRKLNIYGGGGLYSFINFLRYNDKNDISYRIAQIYYLSHNFAVGSFRYRNKQIE